jgi:hypothetical protein
LERQAEVVLREPGLGDAVALGVDPDTEQFGTLPVARCPMSAPTLVPLLVKRRMTLSPRDLVDLGVNFIPRARGRWRAATALQPSWPSKVPMLPPCQLMSSDPISSIAVRSPPLRAPSMKRHVATAALVLGRHRVCLAEVLADHLQRVVGDGDGLVVGEPGQVSRFWRSQR